MKNKSRVLKSVVKLTTVLTALALVISSCSKTNNQVKMIPKNALVVVHLNTKSLTSKLSWDEVRQTNWFREIYSDTSIKSWSKKLLDNPAGSGIDLNGDLVVFMQKPAGTDGQIVLEGEIKDAAAFEAFNKNLDEKATASKDGDINMLTLKDETVVGWNDKKFAYVINSPKVSPRVNYEEGMDSLPGNTPLVNSVQNLSPLCKKLFALDTDSSMAKVDKFTSLLKENADVHVWQNNEEIIKSSMQMGMLGMMKLDLIIKGNITTITGNFDNGKVTVKQKFYASAELTDLLKKYGGGKINADMIKNIPSENIDGILAIHFQPEGLKEIIKLTGMDGFLNIFLSQKGISLDDFVKANKGDIMVAVTDFVMKKDSLKTGGNAESSNSYHYDKPDANFIFSVSIGDKPSFDKLMAAGKKLEGDMGASPGISSANNDKFFAVGNSQQNVSKYISGGNNNKFEFIDKISGHPIALFVDIQKILTTAAAQASTDSSGKIVMEESLKTWQNISAMGGDYKDDAFVMDAEINLVDKNTNSLKQLNTYFDKISKILIEKNKRNRDDWARDTLLTPPFEPIDTLPAQP